MRYVLAVILTLLTSQAFGAALVTPAFSKFSSAGMSVDAGKQGTNTMQVVGAEFTKPSGKPTMTIGNSINAKGYASMQAAADDAVSRTKKTIFVPNGTYSGAFSVPSGVSIVCESPAAIFTIPNGSNSDVVTFSESSDGSSMENCTIDGNSANQSAVTNYTAISPNGITVLPKSNKITLKNLTVRNTKNWGIYLKHRAADDTTPGTTNVSILGGSVSGTGQDAIFTRTASGLVIDGVKISDWGNDNADTVAIKNDSVYGAAYNQRITNNVITNVHSTRFAIECQQGDPGSDNTWTNRIYGLDVSHNIIDAGGLTGGSGISQLADKATYSHNILLNGTGSWRTGFEVNGVGIDLDTNLINGGTIMVSPTTGTVTDGVNIHGGYVKHNANNSVGIQIGSNGNTLTKNVSVSDLLIDMTAATGSTTGLGLGGSAWGNNLIQNVTADHVTVIGPGVGTSVVDNGIYIGSSFASSDVNVRNCTVSGFFRGIRSNSATTNEVTIVNNDARNNDNPVVVTAIGTGYREYLNQKTVGSTAITFPDISVTGLSLNNAADAVLDVSMRAGSTADQNVRQSYRDHNGTAKWYTLMEASSANSFMIQDVSTSSRVALQLAINGVARLNSGNDKAVQFNNNANSGTGGVEFWSGGAVPTKVGSVSAAGVFSIGTSAFSALGTVPAAGTMKYCTDCGTASTCAGSGSGHMAVSNGTNWTCN